MIQIFIFVVLSSFSVLVLKQMDYFQSKPLGYNPVGLIVPKLVLKKGITMNGINAIRIESFMNELTDNPNISEGSFFAMEIPPFTDATHASEVANIETPDEKIIFIPMHGDTNTVKTMGFEIVKGRNFSKNRKDEILMTETGARFLGLDDPIGKQLVGNLEIVGIIKDFHSQSFRLDMGPLYMSKNDPKFLEKWSLQLNFAFRYDTKYAKEVRTFIQQRIEELFPEYDYTLEFQEDRIKGLYENEKKVAQTVIIGVAIVIFISTMGLFALSLYESERRIKEIAIRKINGANPINIVVLLSKEFTKWVLLAFTLAIPVSYLIMNKWLENFIYQTLISWWIFILVGIITVLIAWGTISIQSLRAAMINPVDALRND